MYNSTKNIVGGIRMFFTYPQDFKERELAPGAVTKLVWGERITLSYLTLKPKSSIPLHSHPNEQVGIVIDGEFIFAIGKETRLCKKGDAFVVPGDVEHSVVSVSKPTLIVETFSPPREDFK